MNFFHLIDEGDVDSIEYLLETDKELVKKSNEEVSFLIIFFLK